MWAPAATALQKISACKSGTLATCNLLFSKATYRKACGKSLLYLYIDGVFSDLGRCFFGCKMV